MITEYYIEVPGTNIKESVSGFAYDTLYDMAQQYGIAELVWYALNGTRVVEGVIPIRIKPIKILAQLLVAFCAIILYN